MSKFRPIWSHCLNDDLCQKVAGSITAAGYNLYLKVFAPFSNSLLLYLCFTNQMALFTTIPLFLSPP